MEMLMLRIVILGIVAFMLMFPGCRMFWDDSALVSPCRLDSDCPKGNRCEDGHCLPETVDGDHTETDDDAADTDKDAVDTDGDGFCGAPVPALKLAQGSENPEPLDTIVITAEDSASPFGDSRKPLDFYWEWAENGKPLYASDALLIGITDSFDNPIPLTGKWVEQNGEKAKLYVPIAGTYRVKVKVRDTGGVVSGPTEACPNAPEWAELPIVVRPSQKLHVEMMWNRGEQTDVDLYLVRYRYNGTFSVPASFLAAAKAEPVVMPICSNNADCFNGKLVCSGNGFCINTCASDAECAALSPGWICNEFNKCTNEPNFIIGCKKDSDCPVGAFCNPANVVLGNNQTEYRMICTNYDHDALNDTCYYSNPGNINEAADNSGPRWGGYHDLNTACTSDDVCDPYDSTTFTCDGTKCNYACSASSECLKASSQYLCGEAGQCVGNDTADDPSLDIDDPDGWGPENISLKTPQSGRYRVVARFYNDMNDVVNSDTPLSPLNIIVQVYLSGEPAFSHTLAREVTETMTYWKVADILWDAEANDGQGSGRVVPLCAGWTETACQTNAECESWLHVCDSVEDCRAKCGDNGTCETFCLADAAECKLQYDYNFTCEKREWGKWCSTCDTEAGSSLDCINGESVQCYSDKDCEDLASAKYCRSIEKNFCRCTNVVEMEELKVEPYANPFIYRTGGVLDPGSASGKYSIWCDKPKDKLNATKTCLQLYSK